MKTLSEFLQEKIDESEVPVNNAGDGNIAAIGVGAHGEPGVRKKRKTPLARRNDPL